ncbi:MAG: hypothetical protein KBT36_15610 [Kurthia sp.]|nr:hypothetical protein [Candidatus Kurthia equi]
MYRQDLQNHATDYIERLADLPLEDKKAIHVISMSFIQFLSNQMKQQKVDVDALEYWVKLHQKALPYDKTHLFSKAVDYVITQVLNDIHHANKQQILDTHLEVMQKIMRKFAFWNEQTTPDLEFSTDSLKKINEFSKVLIELNGTEDLPILLAKTETIFGYKRSIFYSYNPWLNEFSGMIGYDLPRVQRMRGNIELEPVFALKKPVFLKDPSPYVQPIAIDLFELSSIIFIPLKSHEQLFGWISFDQQGEIFDCSDEQLALMTEVGHLTAMYISRKQYRSTVNHRIEMTEKDYAILYLLAEGYSNKEMATMLYLSEFTVRDYIQKLMQKFHAKNRTQIISTAFRMGIVE